MGGGTYWVKVQYSYDGEPVTARAEDRAALLSAIHSLENPYNLTKPGAHGELGAYQFRQILVCG